jgi:hypothetical protein
LLHRPRSKAFTRCGQPLFLTFARIGGVAFKPIPDVYRTADDGQLLFNDREAPLKWSQAYPDFDLISYGAIDRAECSLLGYHNEIPQSLSKQRRLSILGSPRKIDVVDTIGLARRKFLHLAAGAAALPTLSRFAWAQAYPSHIWTEGFACVEQRALGAVDRHNRTHAPQRIAVCRRRLVSQVTKQREHC